MCEHAPTTPLSGWLTSPAAPAVTFDAADYSLNVYEAGSPRSLVRYANLVLSWGMPTPSR